MTEMYQDDVDIILPLLSYETNSYGSTLIDRFIQVLTEKLWLNSGYAIWCGNRVWKWKEEGCASHERTSTGKSHRQDLTCEEALASCSV